jgi:hypothetical protein
MLLKLNLYYYSNSICFENHLYHVYSKSFYIHIFVICYIYDDWVYIFFQILLIDSRSFLEYNTSRIQQSVNLCCSKLVKRRLQLDKVQCSILVTRSGNIDTVFLIMLINCVVIFSKKKKLGLN